MQPKANRYPLINIRSKNEIAKRISGKHFIFNDALNLINEVLANHDKYWHDNKKNSEPDKNKYVRSAYGTPLGKLLKLIDKKILSSYDYLAPNFIYGGISGKDHVKAACYLLGQKRQRTKLGLDISRFFEQNTQQRVFYFFYNKCGCSVKASRILADLCCVPRGPKNSGEKGNVLARGFATSTRLAMWCNLDIFLRVYWAVCKKLKGHNPKIAIFVDDIGITASRIEREKIEILFCNIEDILKYFDASQTLPLNIKKKSIQEYKDGNIEHLGLRLGRKKISFGKKTAHNLSVLNSKLKQGNITNQEKRQLIRKKKAYQAQKAYIKNVSNA